MFVQGGTEYSHAYIRFIWSGINEEVVTEASHMRLHIEEHTNWLTHNVVIYEKHYDIPHQKFIDLQRFVIHNNFKSYGLLTVLGIFIKKVFKKSRIGDDGDKTFICSEWVARCFEEIDEQLLEGVNLGYITPKELYEIIKDE